MFYRFTDVNSIYTAKHNSHTSFLITQEALQLTQTNRAISDAPKGSAHGMPKPWVWKQWDKMGKVLHTLDLLCLLKSHLRFWIPST